MKIYLTLPILTLALLYAGLSFWLQGLDTLLIESLESKTKTGGDIYNKIKFIQKEKLDIWMMKQSHQGLSNEEDWDRLAIVVDKSIKPHKARFYQLESGPLMWTGKAKEIPYKVACFLCHSNGPRAIRPSLESSVVPLSFKERLKVFQSQISWVYLKKDLRYVKK